MNSMSTIRVDDTTEKQETLERTGPHASDREDESDEGELLSIEEVLAVLQANTADREKIVDILTKEINSVAPVTPVFSETLESRVKRSFLFCNVHAKPAEYPEDYLLNLFENVRCTFTKNYSPYGSYLVYLTKKMGPILLQSNSLEDTATIIQKYYYVLFDFIRLYYSRYFDVLDYIMRRSDQLYQSCKNEYRALFLYLFLNLPRKIYQFAYLDYDKKLRSDFIHDFTFDEETLAGIIEMTKRFRFFHEKIRLLYGSDFTMDFDTKLRELLGVYDVSPDTSDVSPDTSD